MFPVRPVLAISVLSLLNANGAEAAGDAAPLQDGT